MTTFNLRLRTRIADGFRSTWINPGGQPVTRSIPEAAFIALTTAGQGEPPKQPGVNPNAAWANAVQIWRWAQPGAWRYRPFLMASCQSAADRASAKARSQHYVQ